MKKNTLENKAKFFALYWGKTFINGINGHSVLSFTDINDISKGRIGATLLLTPLSQITDEDLKAIEFTFPHGREGISIEFTPDDYLQHWSAFNKEGYLTLKDFDYLRSKGYALPYMGITVEQLQEWDWIKLKEVQS